MDTCYNNTYFQNTAYPSGNSDPGMCMMSIHATRSTNDLDSKKKGANVTHDDVSLYIFTPDYYFIYND